MTQVEKEALNNNELSKCYRVLFVAVMPKNYCRLCLSYFTAFGSSNIPQYGSEHAFVTCVSSWS